MESMHILDFSKENIEGFVMCERNSSKNNIILIGFMGTGKSTIARHLNTLYGMRIAEMDEMIVEQQGMSIPEIFAEKGEDYFRALETQLLADLQKENNLVISCGGGAALREENVALMKQNGYVFLLTASPETLYERVGQDLNRPVLNGYRSVEGVRALMEKRREKYEKAADFIVSTEYLNYRKLAREIKKAFDEKRV